MTITDIRIHYKKDTGNNPFYNYYSELYTKFSKGTKKIVPFRSTKQGNDYGIWLESQLGYPTILQTTYYNKTGILPNYSFVDLSLNERYDVKYIYWLEELLLKNNKNV